MNDLIKRLESKEIVIHLAGYRGGHESAKANVDTVELMRLAKLGSESLKTGDELICAIGAFSDDSNGCNQCAANTFCRLREEAYNND